MIQQPTGGSQSVNIKRKGSISNRQYHKRPLNSLLVIYFIRWISKPVHSLCIAKTFFSFYLLSTDSVMM